MKNTAIIYDFDGTLTPESSLEHTLMPYLGIKPAAFWKLCDTDVLENKGDYMLTYMRVALELASKKKKPLSREIFAKMAGRIKYYRGVKKFFARINSFAGKIDGNTRLRHYIISGNLREIISQTKIAGNFHNIFGCEYYYRKNIPVFPKVLVNEVLKTQFIHRINKGTENIYSSIFKEVPPEKRPVNFKNMIYIGDGLTDMPSMKLVRDNGGYSIAVYNPKNKKEKKISENFVKQGKADFAVPADYSPGRKLDSLVKSFICSMAG